MLSRWAEVQKQMGRRIALVPTMGALHDGHISLIHRAQQAAELVVVSIFVNPLQFRPGEDFEAYPRDEKSDLGALRAQGVDAVFLPVAEDFYPRGSSTNSFNLGLLGAVLEGHSRPGHFDGVAAAVSRLFEIVVPDVAVFGKKDAQQLAVVLRLARESYPSVEILAAEVVRDGDGLALSSRNAYLSHSERSRAVRFPEILLTTAKRLRRRSRPPSVVLEGARKELSRMEGVELDYLELVDSSTFQPTPDIDMDQSVLVGAIYIGTTRLIDSVWVDGDW